MTTSDPRPTTTKPAEAPMKPSTLARPAGRARRGRARGDRARRLRRGRNPESIRQAMISHLDVALTQWAARARQRAASPARKETQS
jgi:hypothetical protein